MELVNIGAKVWVNPVHAVAVEIVDEAANLVQIYFNNGTIAVTGFGGASAVTDGMLSISHKVWVRPEAIVDFSVTGLVATLRTIVPEGPEFTVELEDEAQLAVVLHYFETGGEVKE